MTVTREASRSRALLAAFSELSRSVMSARLTTRVGTHDRSGRREAAAGDPVLQALSRFVGESLGLPVEDRLEGSLAATAVAAWLGTTVFRAHDVRATRRLVDMVATIWGDRAPVVAVRGVRTR